MPRLRTIAFAAAALALPGGAIANGAPAGDAAAGRVDFRLVVERARALAREPCDDAHGRVPAWLREMDGAHWRDIRFRREATLWRDAERPFRVQLFHPGHLFGGRPARQ